MVKRLLLVFLAGVAVAVLYQQHQHTHSNRVDGRPDKIRLQTTAKRTDVSPSEAIQRDAVAKMIQGIRNEADADKRQIMAAENFIGMYMVNGRARAAYCSKHGVDIRAFSQAFEQAHAKELVQARTVLAGKSFDEERAYRAFDAQMQRNLDQEMNDIAIANRVSIAEVCQYFAKNAKQAAADMHVSKTMPAVYGALYTGEPSPPIPPFAPNQLKSADGK